MELTSNLELNDVNVETRKTNYAYNDGDDYYFIDDDFNMVVLNYEDVKNVLKYLKETVEATINTCNGKVVSVELEEVVELCIIKTEPCISSVSIINKTKDATLQTGLVIQVPSYLEAGDVVRINTKTVLLV